MRSRNAAARPARIRPAFRSLALLAPLAVSAPLLLSCGSPLETLNALTPKGDYERGSDVAFGDAPRQRLDVYRASRPVAGAHTIVFVYGGAWRSGKREDYAFVAGALADAGHDVIVPDYRLFPQVTWPAFVEDIAMAVATVDDRALELLGRELDEIVLMGHSSGAHTAALIAASPARWLGEDAPTVSGLIGIAGPYDLPLDDPEVAPVFTGLDDPNQAIPVTQVGPAHPPTLLVHGSDDERVLPKHTERYAQALRDAGVAVEVDTLDGSGHAASIASFAAPLGLLNDASELTQAWLAELPAAPRSTDAARRQGAPD